MTHTINVHPGLVLRDELNERGITQSKLAAHIGVLPKTINEICRGKRGISAEIAFIERDVTDRLLMHLVRIRE